MAERLNRRHQDSVRAKIQASQLINLLTKNALGQLTPELSPGRVQSAKILLDKSVSNAPTELQGAGENGEHVFRLEAPWIEQIAKARGWA